MRRLAIVLVAVVALTALATAEHAPAPTEFEPVLHRFLTRADEPLVSYRGTRRLEGQLAKSPSFWTRRIDVVKQYARVAGLRVPVRIDSTAQIRFAGASTMTMTYDYKMINGIDVTPSQAVAALGR